MIRSAVNVHRRKPLGAFEQDVADCAQCGTPGPNEKGDKYRRIGSAASARWT